MATEFTDGWIHAHWQQILLGLIVFWVASVFLVKVIWAWVTRTLVTQEHLETCRDDVAHVDDKILNEVRAGYATLSAKMDLLATNQREDTMVNSSEHQNIIRDMSKIRNGGK